MPLEHEDTGGGVSIIHGGLQTPCRNHGGLTSRLVNRRCAAILFKNDGHLRLVHNGCEEAGEVARHFIFLRPNLASVGTRF